MEGLTFPATVVYADELAYGLSEVNLLSPLSDAITGVGQTMRRYQIIIVNRNDQLAEYREDLGLASDFDAIQFRIPSFWVHTVGELKEMAETLRLNEPSYLHEAIPVPDSEKFWRRYNDLNEGIRAYRKGKKHYA